MNIYPNNPLMMGQPNFSPYLTNLNVPNYQPVVPNPQNQMQVQGPQRQIDCVNGKQSAFAFPLGPNSSVVLVDNNEPRIYMVTTDSAGYKAVKSFRVIDEVDEENTPIVAEVKDSETESKWKDKVESLQDRLEKLEERLKAYEQSNAKYAGQSKSGNANAQPNDRNGQNGKGSNGNARADGGE